MTDSSTYFPSAGVSGVSSPPCVRRGGVDGRASVEDTPFPAYVLPLLHRECAIEFVDWRWLCSHCLDSEAAALEYFYLSPFYAQRNSFSHGQQETLNERMRRGEHTNTQGFDISQQQGLLFSVTYSNLSDLRTQAPQGVLSLQERELEKREAEKRDEKRRGGATEKTEKEGPPASLSNIPTQEDNRNFQGDFVARCNYFNANAIFHITLFRREPARHGAMLTLPLRVYAIISGKIYRMAPLMEVLQQKMASAMHHLERCFDLLQLGLVRWDLNEGYVWWARLPQEHEEGSKIIRSPSKQTVHPPTSDASENVHPGSPARAEQRHRGSADADALSHRADECATGSAHADRGGSLPLTGQTSAEHIPMWMRRATEWVEEDGCLVKEVFRKTHCEVASRVLAAEQKRLALELASLVEKRKRNEEQWKAARELEVALAAAVNKKLVLYRQHKSEQLKRLPFSQQLRILQALQREEQQHAQRLAQHAAKVSAEA